MAKSKPGKKKTAKTTNRRASSRPVRRKPIPKQVSRKAARGTGARQSWLDQNAHTPVIEKYARQLSSFVDAIADGVIEEHELEAQESRLVRLMKEIEPRLDAELHAKVTQLLCELTAYDLMQALHSLHSQRPRTVFRG